MAASTPVRRLKNGLTVLLVLAAFAYALLFVISNKASADVDLVFTTLLQVPVEVLAIVSFMLGAGSGLLAASLLLYKAHRKNRLLLKQYAKHIG